MFARWCTSGCGLTEIDWLRVLAPSGHGPDHMSCSESDGERHPATWGSVSYHTDGTNDEKYSLPARLAPRAGLEPAAYCLGGKPEPGQTTPTVAQHGADLQRQSPDAARSRPGPADVGSQFGSHVFVVVRASTPLSLPEPPVFRRRTAWPTSGIVYGSGLAFCMIRCRRSV